MNLLRLFYQPYREPFGPQQPRHFRKKRPPAAGPYRTGQHGLPPRDDDPRGKGQPNYAPPAASLGNGQLLPQIRPWGAAVLAEFVADFLLAAEWVLALLNPLDALFERSWELRPAAGPPLESTPVLAAALLEDHAYCLALLTAAPTQSLTAAQHADLLHSHQRMAWMLRTYLA